MADPSNDEPRSETFEFDRDTLKRLLASMATQVFASAHTTQCEVGVAEGVALSSLRDDDVLFVVRITELPNVVQFPKAMGDEGGEAG